MRSKNVDRNKIAFVLNIMIFILVIISLIIMFTGYKFTFVKEPVLDTTKFGIFKFFTIDSNLLMGVVAIIMAHQERKIINGDKKIIPSYYYLLKLVSTTAVSLTLIVVVLYLGRITEGGLISLLQNGNMFLHLIIPLLSITAFTIFERTNKIKFSYIVCSIIPVLLYGIYYVINVVVHLENGVVLPKYDWYYFLQKGINSAYFVAFIILLMTYIIGMILWIINRERKI